MARLKLFLALVAALPLLADTSVKVGGVGVPFDGWPIPFGVEQYTSFQQLYDHTLFSNPLDIGGLTFFLRNSIDNSPTHTPGDGYPLLGAIAPSTYSIRLGTVPYGTILGPDLQANLAAGVNPLTQTSDLTNFFTGTLSGGVNDHFTIVANQSNFIYNPSAGDLILDLLKPLESPVFSLGLDYTIDPLLTTAYSNPIDPPLGLTDCTLGCTDSLALVTQFESAGQSQTVPFLPGILNNGSFEFNDLPSGGWFDPPTAWGFHYIAGTSNGLPSLFSSITFPTGFDSPFTLLDASNAFLGTFSGGDTYPFGSGASEFSITNISPLVDPTSPSAFPLQISFSTPTGSFQMNPLFPAQQTSNTPEPGSAVLVMIALLLVPVLAKTRMRREANPS